MNDGFSCIMETRCKSYDSSTQITSESQSTESTQTTQMTQSTQYTNVTQSTQSSSSSQSTQLTYAAKTSAKFPHNKTQSNNIKLKSKISHSYETMNDTKWFTGKEFSYTYWHYCNFYNNGFFSKKFKYKTESDFTRAQQKNTSYEYINGNPENFRNMNQNPIIDSNIRENNFLC